MGDFFASLFKNVDLGKIAKTILVGAALAALNAAVEFLKGIDIPEAQ